MSRFEKLSKVCHWREYLIFSRFSYTSPVFHFIALFRIRVASEQLQTMNIFIASKLESFYYLEQKILKIGAQYIKWSSSILTQIGTVKIVYNEL